MSTLTIRLPDEKHNRLRQMAKDKGISLNRLIDELSTVAIAEFDASTRFRSRAAKGSTKRGLALLDKLDNKAS